MSPDANLERDLHERITRGDAEAVAEWQELLRPEVVASLIRRGTTETDAEIIWDRVCDLTMEKAAELRPLGSGLRNYVKGAAQDRANWQRADRPAEIALNANRPPPRTPPSPTHRAPGGSEISAPDIESELLAQEDAPQRERRISDGVHRLLRCLLRLSPKDRELAAYALLNAGPSDLRQLRGQSENAVHQSISRARARLRSCLDLPDDAEGNRELDRAAYEIDRDAITRALMVDLAGSTAPRDEEGDVQDLSRLLGRVLSHGHPDMKLRLRGRERLAGVFRGFEMPHELENAIHDGDVAALMKVDPAAAAAFADRKGISRPDVALAIGMLVAGERGFVGADRWSDRRRETGHNPDPDPETPAILAWLLRFLRA